MRRSTYAFCHGDRGAVRTASTCMPATVVATSATRAIPIMQEIPWRLVFREGVPKLLRDPAGGRMGRDIRMNDTSTVMGEDDQHHGELMAENEDLQVEGGA